MSRNGVVVVEKEMKDWKRLYKVYEDWRNRFPSAHILLHFRISTHGGINIENCHPFKVNKSLAFIHNGIIDTDIIKGKSDTNSFNELVLKELPKDFYKQQSIMDLMEYRIGYSKLVFLDGMNNYAIVGEHKGKWDNGNWYSNESYKPSKYIDFGGTKVAKSTFVSKPAEQKELFYDKEVNEFKEDTTWEKEFYNNNESDISFVKCEECNEDLNEYIEKYYGYCDKCLRDYGLLPQNHLIH
jgi:hypothetical protein